MYSRVVTAYVLPDKLEEAVRIWRDSVAPATSQQKGWVSARMLVDRQPNKAMVVAIWETQADIQASGGDYLKGQLAKFVSPQYRANRWAGQNHKNDLQP